MRSRTSELVLLVFVFACSFVALKRSSDVESQELRRQSTLLQSVQDYLQDTITKIQKERTQLQEDREIAQAALHQAEVELKDRAAQVEASRLTGSHESDPNLEYIFVITPTYSRHTQKADLVRLSHTLRLVPNVHWIVIEDAETQTDLVKRILSQSGLRHTHVVARTPEEMQLKLCSTIDKRKGCPDGYLGKLEQSWVKPRGVAQRNAGLKVLKEIAPEKGVFYFGDDDNTYSLELFDVIRKVKNVSVWNVGLSGGLIHEGPIIDSKNGSVTSWHVGWRPSRPFPIDMAAFAVNVKAIHDHPDLQFLSNAPRGYLESSFLQQIVRGKEEVDVVVPDCHCVLVWHTRTEKPLLNRETYTPSDTSIEV